MRLLLIRHEQPQEDARGRCYGRLDIGLSPNGARRAELLARALRGIRLAAVYASPRLRAVETAAPLAAAHGLVPTVDEALREIDFGDFEGRHYDEIAASHPEIYRRWMETPTLVEFPGGESYAVLRLRALGALEAIRERHSGETAAIVSHGGVVRAILADCLQMPDDAIFRLAQSYGAVSIVEWVESTPLVRVVNAPAEAVVS